MGFENVKNANISNEYLKQNVMPPLALHSTNNITSFQDTIVSIYEDFQKQMETLCRFYQPQPETSIFSNPKTTDTTQPTEKTTNTTSAQTTAPAKKTTKKSTNFQNDTTFNKLMEYVFKDEGGYVNHAKDPGGATNMGICKKWYDKVMGPTTLEEFKNMTQEDAKVYYYKEYWIPSGAKKLADNGNEKLAYAVFDAAIHHGVGTAKRLLKNANGNADLMTDNRLAYMKGLKTWKNFSTGFQARIDKVEDRLSYMA